MRGRGIGTARGRATIMRGAFCFILFDSHFLTCDPILANGMYNDTFLLDFLDIHCVSHLTARRGRGVPAAAGRGIRR